MSVDVSDTSEFTIRFVARPESSEQLPDGSTVIYGAEITRPPRWAGQVRDLIVWADGSIYMGADQRRQANARTDGVSP